MRIQSKLILCALAGSALATAANADTATTTFQVTASVANTCTISASALAFGDYVGSEIDGTTTVTATCSNGSGYNIGLNAGTSGAGSSVTNRRMVRAGGGLLSYALYRDAARTLNWGQTVGTDTIAGSGSGAAQALTVYGRIAAAQTAVSGSYTDTITATITF